MVWMTVGFLTPARAEVKFTDVDAKKHGWAYSSIYTMAQQGVLTGYPDGRFRPEQPVSKAEWTAMVSRLFDKYRPNLNASGLNHVAGFADVTGQHWAYKEISEMYDYSFPIGAYGLNQQGQLVFRPDAALTRLQLAQMLYGFFDNRLMDRRMSENDVCSVVSGFKDVPVQIYTDTDDYDDARKGDGRYASNGSFTDDSGRVFVTLFMSRGADDCRFGKDEFSNMQATALASLQASGIMTANDSGYFRPLDKITRAEAVTILDRIYNYLNRNGWLWDYTTKDLNASAASSSGGSADNPYYSSSGSFTGSWGSSGSYNPYGTNTGGINLSDFTVKDYFDDKGRIVKDLRRNGEIETAVSIGDNKYATIHLESKEKVDLWVIVDGQIAFVKQEELPITIPVEGVGEVGFKTQQRDPKPLVKIGDFTATLSVELSKEPPAPAKSSTKKK
jgi:hypothetical protein